MFKIKRTDEFDSWLSGLKDSKTKARLLKRLTRAERGALGDVEPVGQGVMEMREFFGPGWRMYYIQKGDTLLLMLGGGDKSTQSRDISAAKDLVKIYDEYEGDEHE